MAACVPLTLSSLAPEAYLAPPLPRRPAAQEGSRLQPVPSGSAKRKQP